MRNFIVAVLLFTGVAYAEPLKPVVPDEPKQLTEEQTNKIVDEMMPTQWEISTSKADKEEQATLTCEKVLAGLKVSKKCCADENCVRRVLKKQADKVADEEWRRKVNTRRCINEVSDSDKELCKSDPEYARRLVKELNDNERRKLEENSFSSQPKEPKLVKMTITTTSSSEEMEKIYQDCLAAGGDSIRCNDREEAERIIKNARLKPVDKVVETRSTEKVRSLHLYDLGVGLTGVTAGAYGANVYFDYRPPILGNRLVLNVGAGAVVLEDPNKDSNVSALITRGLIEMSLSYRFIDEKDWSVAGGLGLTRIGRFGFDRTTSNQVGAELTLRIGEFRLTGAIVNNTAPERTYLDRGYGAKVTIGWDFHRSSF